MSRLNSTFQIVGWLITVCLWLGVSPTHAAEARRAPNVVLILMDDMGWRDVGFMGNNFVETPHIDRMAKTGVVFTQAYASAPNCAPTRACLMSGQYAPRHGIYTVVDPRQPPGSPWQKLQAADSRPDLAPEVVTIAESLRAGGYATAFFGMWNLGRGRSGPVTPGGQGFEHVVFPENLGFAKDAYFDKAGNYLSDRLTDEVLKFMDAKRDQPFFVYLADHAVHAPFEPKQDLLKKYQQKNETHPDARNDPAYAATIEAVDHNVGRIMETLNRLKLADETVVIFTSDNGGTPQYTAPLKGSKGQLYEGGIRVPLVMASPRFANPGTSNAMPVASIDLYPTLIDLAGVKPPTSQVLDGVSLASVLKGQPAPRRNRLFWHFPCYVGRAGPSSAMREGNYKIIESFEKPGRPELYDLSTDPNEQHDLAAIIPDKAAAMYKALKDWQAQTKAAIPSGPNLNYDANAGRPRGGQNTLSPGTSGKGSKDADPRQE
jgi:arylsulfatase A